MKLFEKIDKTLLAKIPNFDVWRESGGSMEGYYRDMLSKKYGNSPIRRQATEEHLKWALEQEPEKGPDGAIWKEEDARKMSEIVRRWPFVYYNNVYYHDNGGYPDIVRRYFKNGKHESEEDQGYRRSY